MAGLGGFEGANTLAKYSWLVRFPLITSPRILKMIYFLYRFMSITFDKT